jgi:hypothetical protein
MAQIKLKSTVVVPKVVIIACAVVNAATALELDDMLVTSGNDSQHMPGSRHYRDQALDFRTKHLTTPQKHALAAEVRRRLGAHYDVILEAEGKPNEHLHVEYDK